MKTAALMTAAGVLAAGLTFQARRAEAGGLKAFHRSGQTFVTWREDADLKGEQYHVLIAAEPLTRENLKDAKVAAKIFEGSGQFRVIAKGETGLYKSFRDRWPWLAGLWLTDVDKGGRPLPPGTGLFVRTAKRDGTIHLAVRTVHDGKVVATEVLDGAVEEKVAPPQAIKMAGATRKGVAGGWYLLYMDFDKWNPDGVDDNWEAVAYPFNVGVMAADAGKPLPAVVRLHAYGAYQDAGWATKYARAGFVHLCPIDQHLTWWYGYNDALPARKKNRPEPAPGKLVVNYTEQQVLAIVDWLKRGPGNFPGRIDPEQVSVWGGSMGGSGANVFGMRHGEVFAGAQGIAGYTSWGLDPAFNIWFSNSQAKFGDHADNPATNEGARVYDLLDMPKWFQARPDAPTPYLDIAQGITDSVIPFHSFPAYLRALERTKRPYAASWGIYGHGGRSSAPMDFRLVRRDESLPALAGASCNTPLRSGFRILMLGAKQGWSNLTAKTMTIKPGAIPDNRRSVHVKGSFPEGLAGKTLVLGPTPLTRKWWTIKSNTPTEVTIEDGDMLAYTPPITDYTLTVWKRKNKIDNPTEKDLAPLKAARKKNFAILDGEPFGTWNGHFAWSSSRQNFDPKSTGDDIVDETGRWAMCIRLVKNRTVGEWPGETATVDVTPRRTRKFRPAPGEKVRWVNLDCSKPDRPRKIDEGTVAADARGLVTVPKFVVGKAGWGNRLVLTRPAAGSP